MIPVSPHVRAYMTQHRDILTILYILTIPFRWVLGRGVVTPFRPAPSWPRPGAVDGGDGQRPLRWFSGTGRALRGRDCTKLHHPQVHHGPRP